MQIHGLGHIHGPQSVSGPHRSNSAAAASPAASSYVSGADQLDISPEADMVSRARELPDIREDRVAEIRAQIQSGMYETDEKLDIALGRLLDEFAG